MRRPNDASAAALAETHAEHIDVSREPDLKTLQVPPPVDSSVEGDVEAPMDKDDLPPYDEAAAKLARDRRMLGAAIAGSSLALLVSGNSIVAAAVGGGAAYATTREGKLGDAARTIGDKTMDLIDRARVKLHEHRVPERAAAAAAAVSAKAAEIDRQFHLTERGRVAAADVATRLQALDARHGIVERATAAAASATPRGAARDGAAVPSAERTSELDAEAGATTLGVPVDDADQLADLRLGKASSHAAN